MKDALKHRKEMKKVFIVKSSCHIGDYSEGLVGVYSSLVRANERVLKEYMQDEGPKGLRLDGTIERSNHHESIESVIVEIDKDIQSL